MAGTPYVDPGLAEFLSLLQGPQEPPEPPAAPTPGPDLRGQAEAILGALTAAMPGTRTTLELRELTRVENVSGRVSDLRAAGYQISTESRRSPRDGTAEYRLLSDTPRGSRIMDWSIEASRCNWSGLRVRIRPTNLSGRYSPEALQRLQAAVSRAVETWEASEEGEPPESVPEEPPESAGDSSAILSLWEEVEEDDSEDMEGVRGGWYDETLECWI